MQDPTVGKPVKCLFVISNDFGELGFAYSLLAGSQFAADACILLPPHLYELNKDSLPCVSRCYRNFDDIRTESEIFSPDVVFLLSGPLLWENKFASIKSIKHWLAKLRAGGSFIITSDPLLGIAASLKPGDFSEVALWSRPARTFREKLVKFLIVKAKQVLNTIQIKRSHTLFVDTKRIFAMPVDHLEPFKNARPIGFWNPGLLKVLERQAREPKPICLFVLSQLDYQIQSRQIGQARFSDLMVNKLDQIKNLGRHPVLLGPVELLTQLRGVLAGDYDSSLSSSMSCIKFQQLLVSAEHVFYWNMCSHSMYTRLILGKPFHFFARGHLAYIVPRWHQKAIRTYYDGSEPVVNDMAESLDFEKLEHQAAAFQERTKDLLARMRQFPSPDRLVSELVTL